MALILSTTPLHAALGALLIDAAYEVLDLAERAGIALDDENALDDLCVDVAAKHPQITAASLLPEVLRLLRTQQEDAELEAFADTVDAEGAYGPLDEAPSYGPARLHDDDYYARNDAGEYAWM